MPFQAVQPVPVLFRDMGFQQRRFIAVVAFFQSLGDRPIGIDDLIQDHMQGGARRGGETPVLEPLQRMSVARTGAMPDDDVAMTEKNMGLAVFQIVVPFLGGAHHHEQAAVWIFLDLGPLPGGDGVFQGQLMQVQQGAELSQERLVDAVQFQPDNIVRQGDSVGQLIRGDFMPLPCVIGPGFHGQNGRLAWGAAASRTCRKLF